eukprot:CAMPEP_0170076714 /NCGR_PEP_ID=MMETSP0019_2-20121128/13666_1 /TAXON_ID=98059 /ORGANISM="Dinobryon sp., Strain UTEXLB2267" /LENGTH=41 /DNA_ID= /DNA_START= /DNA_END= /DNA_ORIENTATION=
MPSLITSKRAQASDVGGGEYGSAALSPWDPAMHSILNRTAL